eukprot:Pgem_evm1s12322
MLSRFRTLPSTVNIVIRANRAQTYRTYHSSSITMKFDTKFDDFLQTTGRVKQINENLAEDMIVK